MVSRGFISTVLFVVFISASFTMLGAQETWDSAPSLPKEPYDIRINPILVDSWLRSVPLKSQGKYDSVYIKQTISVLKEPDKVHVLKVDSAGMYEWSRTYGIDSAINYGSFISQDADGGYVIAGNSEFTRFENEGIDWIMKFDSTGSFIWDNKLNRTGLNSLYHIQVIPDEYLITGSHAGISSDSMLMRTCIVLWSINSSGETISHEIPWVEDCSLHGRYIDRLSDGSILSVGSGGCSNSNDFVFIITFDSHIKVIGSILLGYEQSERYRINHVIKTSSGGYLLTGSTDDELWLGMLDSLGDTVWTRTRGYEESSYVEGFYSVELPDGNFIVSSTIQSYPPKLRQMRSIQLSKISNTGKVFWSRSYGEEERVFYPEGLVSTSDGGIMMAVYWDYREIGIPPLYWLVKFDSRGNPLWRRPLPYHVRNLAPTRDGGAIMVFFRMTFY